MTFLIDLNKCNHNQHTYMYLQRHHCHMERISSDSF